MGNTLTNRKISQTYQGLIKLEYNTPITSELQYLTDGFGNNTNVKISQDYLQSNVLNLTNYPTLPTPRNVGEIVFHNNNLYLSID